ncbi:hypothetical protein [Marinicella sp. W31]|uniref:hypothetical protein n=1 Tax=Marinicella sp. W31 TaxID=3023713 RepID=UPI0037572EFB
MKYLLFILIPVFSCMAQDILPGSKVYIDTTSTDMRIKTTNSMLQCYADEPISFMSCGAGTTDIQGECFAPPNTSFNIDYGVTSVASCVGVDGTPDWQSNLNIGMGSINTSKSVNGITQDTTFTMNCQRPNVATVYSESVTVKVKGPCSALPPINISRQPNPDEFFDLTMLPFGSATGVTARFSLFKNNYSSLRFTAPVQALTKKIFFENGRPDDGGPAPYTVVISQCPGDFTDSLGSSCKVSGPTPTLRWTSDVNNTSNFRCKLEPGEDYYINIVHSLNEGSGYEVTDCNSTARCGVLFAELF